MLALPARAAVDERAVLQAIAAVETGDRYWLIGRSGERSAWQMTEETWRRYTSAPFVQATTNPLLARIVAATHLRWIMQRLQQRGRPVTAMNIARRWNPGAPADYAQRVANLVGSTR